MFPTDGLKPVFWALLGIVAVSWGVVVGMNACGYEVSWWWLMAAPGVAVIGILALIVGLASVTKYT